MLMSMLITQIWEGIIIIVEGLKTASAVMVQVVIKTLVVLMKTALVAMERGRLRVQPRRVMLVKDKEFSKLETANNVGEKVIWFKIAIASLDEI